MFQRASLSSSPQNRWTSSILSSGVQTPLQFQSKDAAHEFPAFIFHSQSKQQQQTFLLHFNPKYLSGSKMK